ncbi:MAG: glycosyltransferase family 2 protein [Arcobacteraceae bacterium]|nr:glycosyltransferase family 2 protein [Arcobacteraceae bacterium]
MTVITVTYNAEQYLERTIKSVISQNYSNIEYIIIDGASTDGTIDIIRRYEQYITYWISESDSGIYDAMNKGIDISSGVWINFMNAGDTFVNRDIVTQVADTAQNESVDIIYGDTNIIKNNFLFAINKAEPMDKIWEHSFCNHQSLFVKSYIMKELQFDINYKIAAEKDLFFKLYKGKYKYSIIQKPLTNFIIDDNSTSYKYKILDSVEMLQIILKNTSDAEKIYSHQHYKNLTSYNPYNDNSKSSLSEFSSKINSIYNYAKYLSDNYNEIVIYGYGAISKMIQHLFHKNKIYVIDKQIPSDNVLFFSLDNLNEVSYDIILISVLNNPNLIKDELIKSYKVDKSKIVLLSDFII